VVAAASALFPDCCRVTRNPEIGRTGRGSATMTLPGETEAALRGRNHAEAYSGGLIETMNGAQMLPLCALQGTTSDR
jgi:hypothetical protein